MRKKREIPQDLALENKNQLTVYGEKQQLLVDLSLAIVAKWIDQ